MIFNSFLKRTAAALTAAVLISVSLSGCSMFRPIDGAGRENVTDTTVDSTAESSSVSADTDDTSVHPPETGTTAVTSATEPPVSVPQEKRISILAVGDNIIHEAVYIDAKSRADDGAEYDFLPMYNGVADAIKEADIAFVNQEAPMAGKKYGISGYPTFNAPQEAGRALADVGFDVINLANNHIMDKQSAGARATVEFVQSLPVTELGVYLNQEDYDKIRITEVNGIRVAWVSFTQDSNNPYDSRTAGVILPMMNDDKAITARIQDAREAADFVIVSAHWGLEKDAVTNEQRRLAKVIAEAGADVVIGHHSHVLQPMEWITSSSGKKTLVAYSLGNFLSSQLYAKNMIGGMLSFDIVKDADGRCTLDAPLMHISVNHYSGKKDSSDLYGVRRYAMQMYSLENYTETLAAAHGCRYFSSDFSVKWIYQHVRSIIAEEFLPAYFE